MESVKRRASPDETGMVGVQWRADAGASSHQTRKRCRKAKIVEVSSDQPQEGGGNAEVVEGSSDQPKKRGPKTKLLSASAVKDPKKQERDKQRYKKMKDAVQKVEILEKKNAELERELETQKNEKMELEILKNKFAEFEGELKTQKNETKELRVEVGKLNSELVPAITENLKPVTEQLEIVTNDYKKMESLIEGFAQSENGWKIPLDYGYLDGKENRSMFLAFPEHISNGKNLMTDLENPADFSDLLGGMSKEEILARFGKTTERHEELEKEIEGIKSRLTNIETMITAMKPKK